MRGPSTGDMAPDFELDDTAGTPVKLSEYKGNKAVILVFNRGFG
jgi:mycoredoxin-dependent peroxiredoxin